MTTAPLSQAERDALIAGIISRLAMLPEREVAAVAGMVDRLATKPKRTRRSNGVDPVKEKARLERKKNRQAEKRRAAGAVSRAEYEGNSLSKAKPWETEGVSRATWYRRQRWACRSFEA